MKKPKKSEKEFGRDITEFEKLPPREKELLRLQQQAEKATGKTSMAINQRIRERAK